MYCPSCGEPIPDNSAFCLHCGARIVRPAASEVQQVTEWDYKDFVIIYPPGERGWAPAHYYTEPEARQFFWNHLQPGIAKGLQTWLDAGWQPVGEVGATGLRLRHYRTAFRDWGCLAVILAICTGGILFLIELLAAPYYFEATEFRLQMRRPKKIQSGGMIEGNENE